MQIAICDDEPIFRTQIHDLLIEYKTERRIQIDIYEFEYGKDFLACELAFDMVFLDYQMLDLDGLETAKQLRLNNSLCHIVFVTSYSDLFIKEAFEVNTYRFFDKPVRPEQIFDTLDSYIRQQKELAPIVICDADGQKTIATKDILFIEGNGKYCIIHTVSGTIQCSKTVAGVLALLPQYCFFRTHKSFVVNMYFVSKIQNDTILMINGEAAFLSRKYTTSFKKSYMYFVKNYFVRL